MSSTVKLVNPSPGQLLDLCLLGLMWRREASDVTGCLANGIMTAMRSQGVFGRSTLEGLGTNSELIRLARENGQEVMGLAGPRGVKLPPKRDLDRQIADSDKWFLYVRVPDELMSWPFLFLPGGYPLVITEAGIKYVAPKAAEFAQIIPRDLFLARAGGTRVNS